MRGLGRLASSSNSASAKPSAIVASSTFSTFAGGRGRGRGSGSPPPPISRALGDTNGEPEPEEPISHGFPAMGHGRGKPLPPSAVLPSLSSWVPGIKSSAGRGRTSQTPPQTDSSENQQQPSKSQQNATNFHPKKPIFFLREEAESEPSLEHKKIQFPDFVQDEGFSPSISTGLQGSGRGKPMKPAVSEVKMVEENRHIRPALSPRRGKPDSPSRPPAGPSLSREEAVRKAKEILSRGGDGGRGRGFRGQRGRGRGMQARRGRGGRGWQSRDADEDFATGLYLGDDADGEKLVKRLGEENYNKILEGFEEMSGRVLPSPAEEAYFDALHTNNLIEYEPEYLMEEFGTNPDIDEKPPIPLREALEKMKPFLMVYEGIKSQEEWEEIIEATMERVPYMKQLIDIYSGPDRVTARQQQQELERVAKTLPENIPASVKRYTDRALLSLQLIV